MYENCGVKRFITNQFNNLLPVCLLHVAQLVECCTRITGVEGSNLIQAWIFSGFLSTIAKAVACITGASWANWSECSILREVQKQVRSMRQGEERNKVPVMHGSIILLVTIPSPLPGQPPGQVQPFGTVWSSPVQGAGGSLWFCEVGAISHTV